MITLNDLSLVDSLSLSFTRKDIPYSMKPKFLPFENKDL